MSRQADWDRVVTLADGTTTTVPTTLWELVAGAAGARPEAVVAVDEHGRTLTRAGLRHDAERVAAALARAGVGPGTVVSWQLPTCIEAYVVMAALARLGAVQNPIIPVLRHREVGFITAQVGTEVFLTPTIWRGFDHEAMVREVAPASTRVITVDLSRLGEVPLCLAVDDDVSELPPPPGAGGVRWLYYSSGTTADPKGVRHRDDTVMASCGAMVGGVGFGDHDVYPIAWPLTHIGGMTLLTTSLVGGVTCVLTDSYDAATTPEAWARFRPTVLGSAVPFFRAYLDAQRRHGDEPLYPDLRAATWGGAPVPAEVHAEMAEVFGVALVGSYGLTEFPIASSAEPGDPHHVLVSSVGRAGPGVEVRIVTTDGAVAAAGEEGEVRLKGPQCFEGYLDSSLDPQAFDDDGWFRTGDLGTLDEHSNLRITGRLKDIVIRNAENIAVLEIEELLFGHPQVADAAVFAMPDPRTGERVCAAVVLRDGAEALTLDQLRDYCREQGLATYKCPEQLEVFDELPRSGMGKVQKQDLRARLTTTSSKGATT